MNGVFDQRNGVFLRLTQDAEAGHLLGRISRITASIVSGLRVILSSILVFISPTPI